MAIIVLRHEGINRRPVTIDSELYESITRVKCIKNVRHYNLKKGETYRVTREKIAGIRVVNGLSLAAGLYSCLESETK